MSKSLRILYCLVYILRYPWCFTCIAIISILRLLDITTYAIIDKSLNMFNITLINRICIVFVYNWVLFHNDIFAQSLLKHVVHKYCIESYEIEIMAWRSLQIFLFAMKIRPILTWKQQGWKVNILAYHEINMHEPIWTRHLSSTELATWSHARMYQTTVK